MNIETFISDAVRRSVEALYGELGDEQLQIQKTRREFEGDYTLVTFPLLRRSRKSPEATATEIGEYMAANVPEIASFNVIKGFLNLSLDSAFWAARFAEVAADERFGQAPATGRTVMVEYSSPNTNKPLHLGHIRNNLLGYSVAQILKANGHTVIKANLVNDRGIHICKSMLAWKLYGNGETPASSGMKGDHLVGKYYVEFDKHYKAQIRELVAQGQPEDEAKKNAPIMLQAQEMLRKWEARDPEVYSLWETMNGWVYEGFDVTYKALGVDFDKVYYESQTYLLGKSLVEEGLKKGVFYRRPDNSVWIDLTADGLDEKLLLRGDADYSIRYQINLATLNAALNGNPQELDGLNAFVDNLVKDTLRQVCAVTITGYSSPDGPLKFNEALAAKRAGDFKAYVDRKYDFSKKYKVTVNSVAEDWETCRALVAQSSMPDRQSVLNVIDGKQSSDQKELALKKMPAAWSYLKKNVLPKLRRVELTIGYGAGNIVEQRTMIPKPKPAPQPQPAQPAEPYVVVDEQVNGIIVEMPDRHEYKKEVREESEKRRR